MALSFLSIHGAAVASRLAIGHEQAHTGNDCDDGHERGE
jgi:hypothetical protein